MSKKIVDINVDKLNSEINPEEITAAAEEITEATKGDDIPRLDNGNIDIESIAIGKDDKSNYIVADDIFDKYFRELPNNTVNESRSWRTTATGGKIKILGGDPERDKLIQYKGGKALQATIKQQRTFAEAISAVLAQKASEETRNELHLDSNADNLDAVIAAMLRQATRGNVKAGDFLRDTIGQKPSDRLEATVENLTAEDREMLENIKNRLGEKP